MTWSLRWALLGLLACLTACAAFEPRSTDGRKSPEPLPDYDSFLTIGYGGTEAEARAEALQKALRLAAGPWSSPKFGIDRSEAVEAGLQDGGAGFVRGVDVRLRGASGPSSFVLAEIEVDRPQLFAALDRVVTGPMIEPAQEIPEPVSWWQSVLAAAKSLFRLSTYTRLLTPAGADEDPEVDQAPDFVPVAAADPRSGAGAFGKGLSHYYVDPFSRPRDYLMADVVEVGMVPGAMDSGLNALGVTVSLTPDPEVINALNGVLRAHGSDLGSVEDPACLAVTPDSSGKKRTYVHRSCRVFTSSYPESVSMLALNFVGDSGVVATLMLADDPFRVGFGERYLEKFETLYVRHSDTEYAAWAWRPDVRRVRGRDSDFHVMPYAILECGEDKIGTCTDWSKRYRVFLGVHGGTEQQIRFVLGNMPTDVLSKTKFVLAEVIEVRKGEIISDMLPPGVRLTPERPPPALSHPLDKGRYSVGRSY